MSRLVHLVTTACNGGDVIARPAKQLRGCVVSTCGEIAQFDHVDTIDRAGGKAQIAASAVSRQHGMHALRPAHNGIDRARWYAKRASDTTLFVDDCGRTWTFTAVFVVKGNLGFSQQFRDAPDTSLSPWRTLIVRGLLMGDRRGICAAVGITATSTLCLR